MLCALSPLGFGALSLKVRSPSFHVQSLGTESGMGVQPLVGQTGTIEFDNGISRCLVNAGHGEIPSCICRTQRRARNQKRAGIAAA